MQHLVSVPSRRLSLIVRLFAGVALATAASLTAAQAQIVVGPNVNMVGAPGYVGPDGEIINDPTLNRQNEPSHAFSTRNPCHILAGANDYRLVDFEVPLLGDERADAWLGVFKSFDCGRTWTSTPHPGHQLDLSAAGQASPIFGRQAAADATVRALPAGKFLMSGLAFDRGGVAKVFVSVFEDRNNEDGGDSIDWLGTTVLDSGQSGQFLDKPWMATTNTGQAYLAYTVFLGSGNNIHTKIMVAKFNGTTWSNSQKVSESVARNQGTTIAVDPGTGYVYIAWREFTDPRDSIVVIRSTDGGNRYSAPQRVEPLNASGVPYRLKPFDQDASFVTFRTFSYPTIAIMPAVAEGRLANQPGRVYLAWAASGFVPLRNNQMPGQTSNQTRGDTRIVYSTSIDGTTWTYPKPADDTADAGHQLMPALASAGGKLALAYYDLRADASLTFDDNVVEYGQAALDSCMAQSIGVVGFNVVQCMIALPSVVAQRRHTLDVRAAVADGNCLVSGACTLSSVSALNGNRQVSRYLHAYTSDQGLVQLQYNSPNLPLFQKGSRAFIGDYIDIQGLDYVPNGSGGWAWNTGANAGSPAPLFMVTWADNRNVRRPGTAGWERFTRINSAACEAGQAGIRNQDIYSAVIRSGLSVSAPLNARRIGDLQRSFPIVIANNTDQLRSYQASVNAPANVVASFDQFAGFGVGVSVTSLELSIPPRSTATRTVFVLKKDGADANVLVPVLVAEVGGGLTDTVFLNPDLSNPDAADSSVGSEEFHVPVLGDPTLQTFINAGAGFKTPDFDTPDFDTPDFDTPDFDTPDFDTAAVADVSWKVTNIGNVTSAYKPNINIQNPKGGTRYQLVVRTVTVQSLTSAISCTTPGLLPQNQMLVNIVDPHVQSPLVGLTSTDFNNPDPKNATFTLGSNQSAVITLRAYCNAHDPLANGPGGCAAEGPLPRELDAAGHPTGRPLVSTSSVAQAANCQRCTGASCNLDDFVGSGTVCALDDGLPKDIYDPISPVWGPAPALPPIADEDNNGSELVRFAVSVTDNIAVTSVACTDGAVTPGSPGSYSVSGTFPVGTTAVTCNAADGSGNHSELNFNVVVNDVTAPVFDVTPGPDAGAPYNPSNPAEATGSGGAQVFYTNPSASDSNGGPVTVTCASPGGLASGSTFPVGTTDINCTATDTSGVSTPPTNLFDITVADRTPPVVTITGAPAATVEGGVTGGAIVTFSSSARDSVSGTTVSTCSPASGSLFPLGATTVSCSSTDGSGNTGSTTFVVTVADTTAPVMAPITNRVAEATGPLGAIVTYPNPAATDVVDASLTIACAAPSGTTFPIGSSAVTCTATDDSGNVGNGTFTVVVRDTTAPVFGPSSNATAEATGASGAIVTYITPGATDTVGATVSCVPVSGSMFAIGTTTVVCTATDAANNRSSTSLTVTVRDTTAPVIGAVSNLTAEATSPAGATVAYASPSVSDVVGATVACAPASGSTFAIGSAAVTCTATDAALNTSMATFTVTVVDTTAPIIGAVSNLVAEATSAAGAAVSYTSPVVTDTVGATIACLPASGSTFGIGPTTVTCTARDAANNTSLKTFTVTVRDTTAPVIGPVSNISVPSTSISGATVSYATPTVTDAVGATIACAPASGSTFAIATTTVTCTARDAALNTSTKAFTVTVVDAQPPVVTAAANPNTLLWSPNKTMTPVTVSGKITEVSLKSATFKVADEYGKIQPSGTITVAANGNYSFVISLEAYRNGTDADGRFYTITVTAVDTGNRTASAQAIVAVPHNQ